MPFFQFSYKKSLCLESYLGMTFGFIACIYATIVSDIKLSLVATVIVTLLPYFWIWFIAHEPSFTSYGILSIQRIAIAAALLYFVFELDFGVMNIIYMLQAVNILSGLISSNVAAQVLTLSSFIIYILECQYVLPIRSDDHAPFYWLCWWGLISSITSYVLIFLFCDKNTEQYKQARLRATHWQDNILCLFSIVVGGVLNKADYIFKCKTIEEDKN